MDSRWVGFFVFIWIIGSIMGATYDGFNTPSTWNTAGASSGNMTQTMSDLRSSSVATQRIPIIGAVSFIVPAVNFMTSLVNTVLWNFSFVQPYPMVARILNVFGVIGLVMLFRMIYGSITGNVSW